MVSGMMKYYSGLIPAIVTRNIHGGGDPHVGAWLFSGADSGERTPDGTIVNYSSNASVPRLRHLIPMLYTTPFPGFLVTDFDAVSYVHALFALRSRQTKFIAATFCPLVVRWLSIIENNWD